MRKPTKGELPVLWGIFAWIFIVNIAAPILVPQFQTWPMYFVTIFFFTMGGDTKNIPTIFGGALLGLIMAYVLTMGLNTLAPSIGIVGALVVLLFVILAFIIVGGGFLPVICNNMAFAYMTIATINMELVPSQIFNWIGMLFIGGAVILGGCLVMVKIITGILTKQAAGVGSDTEG